MNRRSYLATGGIGLSTLLAGCLGAATGDESDSSDRPWTPKSPIENPDGTHHLFIENYTDTTEVAWLRVVREDGATLVDGRYELPDRRGIKFEAIAAWETTHTIDLAIDGEDVTSLEWHTPECGQDSEAPGDNGSRNAVVRLEEVSGDDGNRISFVVDQCDALFAPGVPTGLAESFRVDD